MINKDILSQTLGQKVPRARHYLWRKENLSSLKIQTVWYNECDNIEVMTTTLITDKLMSRMNISALEELARVLNGVIDSNLKEEIYAEMKIVEGGIKHNEYLGVPS